MAHTYASDVEVVRAALAFIGQGRFNSMQENSPQARIARAVYEGIVHQTLSKHRWKFASKYRALAYHGVTDYPLPHKYDLPEDCITLHHIFMNGRRSTNYDIEGNKLFFSAKTDVRAFYTARVGEHLWDADFAAGIVSYVEGAFRRGLLKDLHGAKACEDKAEGILMNALTRQQRGQRAPKDDRPGPLVQAHRGQRNETR